MTTSLLLSSTILNNEPLLQKAEKLSNTGIIVQQDAYSFLKVEDAYIHELYALLNDPTVQKPDCFSLPKAAGAHISIIYNEENILLSANDINTQHNFSVKNFSHVKLGAKEYFVLFISAPSLNQLRLKYGLPEKPRYKNIPIDFHITIAVR